MKIEAKSLSSIALLVLCSLSLTWSLPVPRLVYQQSAPNPYPQPQYWELRPAAMEPFMASDAQTALFHSYIQQSRFDPDRPYIQMVVPNNDEDTGASEDRYFPFPVRPTRPPVKTPTLPPEICKNESTNATEINGTAVNRNNITEDCNPPVTEIDERPATALFMLADGTTLYSVGQGDAKPESPLNGAYELAYVARRPAARKLSPYPMVQFADYNQMNRDRLPFFGSPYAAAAYYEPVYIYKPVYPSSSRSYDVYYYLPAEEQEPDTNSEVESQPEATKEEEETGPIREESSEEIARTEFLARDPAPSAEKEEASEIAMADAGGAEDQETLQQEALLNALSSEIEAELQTTTTAAQSAAQSSPEKEDPITKEAKHELAQLLDHKDNNRDYWENELERISNKDLINAVEVVLQQLNSRLSDKQ